MGGDDSAELGMILDEFPGKHLVLAVNPARILPQTGKAGSADLADRSLCFQYWQRRYNKYMLNIVQNSTLVNVLGGPKSCKSSEPPVRM